MRGESRGSPTRRRVVGVSTCIAVRDCESLLLLLLLLQVSEVRGRGRTWSDYFVEYLSNITKNKYFLKCEFTIISNNSNNNINNNTNNDKIIDLISI